MGLGYGPAAPLVVPEYRCHLANREHVQGLLVSIMLNRACYGANDKTAFAGATRNDKTAFVLRSKQGPGSG